MGQDRSEGRHRRGERAEEWGTKRQKRETNRMKGNGSADTGENWIHLEVSCFDGTIKS